MTRDGSRLWAPCGLLVLLLVLWELAIFIFGIPAFILPPLGAIAAALADNWDSLLQAAAVTLLETLVGFVIAVGLGFGLAVGFIWVRAIRNAVYPLVLIVQALPKIAVAPLLVVWLGPTALSSKIVMVVLISVFPVVVNTLVGLEAAEPELIDLFRSMGGSRWQTFLKLQLPGAAPHIFSGLKVGITLAVTGALVAELIGGDRGLGYIINVASGQIDTALMFADLAVLTMMAILLFYAIAGLDVLLNRWKDRAVTMPDGTL